MVVVVAAVAVVVVDAVVVVKAAMTPYRFQYDRRHMVSNMILFPI